MRELSVERAINNICHSKSNNVNFRGKIYLALRICKKQTRKKTRNEMWLRQRRQCENNKYNGFIVLAELEARSDLGSQLNVKTSRL